MKQSNTSKFAYLAGLIDGEGTIGIYEKSDRQDGNSRSLSLYKLNLSIGQKRGKMIDWLFGNFGGGIYIRSQNTKTPDGVEYSNHSMYEWRLSNIDSLEFVLKRVLPFLTEKKDQAQLALEFIYKYKHVSETGKKFGFITKYPEDVIEDWKEFAKNKSEQLKLSKKIFVPCAAVETKLFESSIEGKL